MQKLIDVFEIAVDRGKADVGHFIDLSQPFKNHIAQLMRRNGCECTGTKLDLYIVNDLIELFSIDISLDGGAHQADEQLIAIEPLLGSVRLNDLDRIFASLERCKAVVTLATFATALNGVICLLHTGINDAGMCLAAFGTAHGTSS